MLNDLMRLHMDTARMLAEAQTVIGLRVLGMAGVLPARRGENLRMVTEKQRAFTESGIAAAEAMFAGKTPVQVGAAALKPIGRKTRANSKRLSPKPGGRRPR